MKKFFCFSMVLFIVASMGIVANAQLYENEQYTIEVPDDFRRTTSGSMYISEEKGNLTVSIEEKTDESICVAEMSQKKAQKYAEGMASQADVAFKAFGQQGAMELISASVEEHPDGRKAFVVTLKTTSTEEGKETVRYQQTYIFSGVKNQYSFSYTSKAEKDLEDFKTAFDSIHIFETEDKGFVGDIGAYIAVGAIFGLFVLGIIRFIRTPAKRKAGKIKK